MTQHDFSRRDFLLRTGQYGLALSIFGPGVGRTLLASPVHAPLTAATRDHALASAMAEDIAPILSGLSWRMLGPFRGGRVDAVAGVPGRPNEFFFGAVNGGVWKTVDGGRVWTPVFDSQPVASIGAIAVAPSSPDTVYVGTGESTLRDSMGYGTGMYKSTDAGKSWTHIGLADTQHIGKIAVNPKNPNVVFVAAIGHLYAPNAERGVFRSLDGGRTWKKVLGTDDVGAVEVVIDPANPRVVYAGLWNTRRPPWFVYRPSNGPGGGIYKSTDGGNTWKQLTNGLPKEGIGRTGIAVSPTNPRRVYAVVDCLVPDPDAPVPQAPPGAPPGFVPERPGQGGFFRSDDAGATWTKMSNDEALWGRGWYFEKITVDPKNADIVYVPNVAVNRSMDGGKTWVVLRGSPGGDDYHQFWVSPDDPNTAIVASDQGAVVTRNARTADPRQVTWSSWLNQPTAQIYHVSVDYRTPYWVTGAQQDSGAVAVRSRGKFAEISMRDWEPIAAGGESGYTAGDRLNPGVIFGGSGQRWDLEQNLALPGATPQMPKGETARADWTQPLVFSRADPNALFYANQYLFKSTDHAKSWTAISGDLTYENPPVPATLDAAAADDIEPNRNGRRGVIYTIAPSPISAPMVWVGTDDGRVWLTTNDGANWAEVTPAGLTPWSRVTMMEASHFDVASAYASVDRHQLQDFEPYVYRTRDNGKTWQKITSGLPAGVYVHTVKEDPMRRGLLFAGTERGAFVSLDDGDHWQPLQMNLPVTSVRDFEIYDNDLIVGTFGRGIYVVDDISPLRQLNPQVLASDAHLFKPADVVNYIQGGDNGTPLQKDEPQAPNPASGAAIDYYLKSDATGPVTLEIVNASGQVVRSYSNSPGAAAAAGGRGARGGRTGGIPNVSPLWQQSPEPFATSAGMHRVVWTPVTGGRGFGGFGRQATPLTGAFTARLTVNGKTYTQGFEVKPDPRVAAEPR
ncbi:MAG TPA: glycosyl hydrolase [Gemmatimonadaceae bacterium]